MLLTTGRMLYQYNISTRISESLDMLRPHELAEVNPADAARLGVDEGDVVRVTSRRGSITTRVTVTEKVPPGVVFMTFHYAESPVNELTNAEGDPVTMTAEFKVCAVRMEREPAGMEVRGGAAVR
ncbi:MAG: molybdopterin dinucleotide binding domain-containing protein [Acidobacteriota bacterium]|nr:molybdopterin dinucleotide binding domain-containing protein [Acidobacteriota bacterium]